MPELRLIKPLQLVVDESLLVGCGPSPHGHVCETSKTGPNGGRVTERGEKVRLIGRRSKLQTQPL